MKLFGKILWMVGFVFMAIAITLFMGEMYINANPSVNGAKQLPDITKAALAMGIVGTVSLAIGFVLRLVAKLQKGKSASA